MTNASLAAETPELTVVKSFLDAWADGDTDGVMTLFARDAAFIGSVGSEPGQTYRGHDQIRPAVAKMLAAAAGTRFLVRELIPFDGGVVVTWTVNGTADDGQEVNAKGIDIFRLRGTEIVLKDAYRKLIA